MPIEQNPADSIDRAVLSCDSSIREHRRLVAFELFTLVSVFVATAFFMYFIAVLQGRDNDKHRLELQDTVSGQEGLLKEAQDNYEELTESRAMNGLEPLLTYSAARASAEASAASVPGSATAPASMPRRTEYEYSSNRANYETREVVELRIVEARKRLDDLEKRLSKSNEQLTVYKAPPVLTDSMLYGIGVVWVVLIGVFAGFYRSHLREITRNEQQKLGLLRMKIAADNYENAGFGTEVRFALTAGAFDIGSEEKRRNPIAFESPLPGHPTADIITTVVNKMAERFDVTLRSKQPQENSRDR